jgi:hypothetical protein
MVQVLYDGSMNVGYITGKISSLYREAVDRHDSAAACDHLAWPHFGDRSA